MREKCESAKVGSFAPVSDYGVTLTQRRTVLWTSAVRSSPLTPTDLMGSTASTPNAVLGVTIACLVKSTLTLKRKAVKLTYHRTRFGVIQRCFESILGRKTPYQKMASSPCP